jgi:hypothetical protein
VRPLRELPAAEAARLDGLLFDLDDTLLDHTRLSEAAYSALFRLHEAGLALYAVTGRPAGWAAVLVRQWPLTGAVAENGALGFFMDAQGVHTIDALAPVERAERRARLSALCQEIAAKFPDLLPADDVAERRADFTYDIGEHQRVERQRVSEVVAFAEARGAHTSTSSVHLHVTFDCADKAAGTVRLIHALRGQDPSTILGRYAFIGDSENDASCFAAFHTTIGVRNLRGRPSVPPRYLCSAERGAGFVEAAQALIAARR